MYSLVWSLTTSDSRLSIRERNCSERVRETNEERKRWDSVLAFRPHYVHGFPFASYMERLRIEDPNVGV